MLGDAGQIPSGFGTRAGCLVVLDEGAAEILSAVDGANRERFEPVEGVTTHHDREVGDNDIMAAYFPVMMSLSPLAARTAME